MTFGDHLIHVTFGLCTFVRAEMNPDHIHIKTAHDGVHAVLLSDCTTDRKDHDHD